MIFPAAQIIQVTNASRVKLKVETFAFVVSIELCINLKYKSIWVMYRMRIFFHRIALSNSITINFELVIYFQ